MRMKNYYHQSAAVFAAFMLQILIRISSGNLTAFQNSQRRPIVVSSAQYRSFSSTTRDIGAEKNEDLNEFEERSTKNTAPTSPPPSSKRYHRHYPYSSYFYYQQQPQNYYQNAIPSAASAGYTDTASLPCQQQSHSPYGYYQPSSPCASSSASAYPYGNGYATSQYGQQPVVMVMPSTVTGVDHGSTTGEDFYHFYPDTAWSTTTEKTPSDTFPTPAPLETAPHQPPNVQPQQYVGASPPPNSYVMETILVTPEPTPPSFSYKHNEELLSNNNDDDSIFMPFQLSTIVPSYALPESGSAAGIDSQNMKRPLDNYHIKPQESVVEDSSPTARPCSFSNLLATRQSQLLSQPCSRSSAAQSQNPHDPQHQLNQSHQSGQYETNYSSKQTQQNNQYETYRNNYYKQLLTTQQQGFNQASSGQPKQQFSNNEKQQWTQYWITTASPETTPTSTTTTTNTQQQAAQPDTITQSPTSVDTQQYWTLLQQLQKQLAQQLLQQQQRQQVEATNTTKTSTMTITSSSTPTAPTTTTKRPCQNPSHTTQPQAVLHWRPNVGGKLAAASHNPSVGNNNIVASNYLEAIPPPRFQPHISSARETNDGIWQLVKISNDPKKGSIAELDETKTNRDAVDRILQPPRVKNVPERVIVKDRQSLVDFLSRPETRTRSISELTRIERQ